MARSLRVMQEIPAGPPWVAKAGSGPNFLYLDPTGSTEGIEKIRLRTNGKGNKTVLRLDARGLNMTLPGPFSGEQYFAQDPEVIVQIENSEGGCWQIELDGQGQAKQRKQDRYGGRSQPRHV